MGHHELFCVYSAHQVLKSTNWVVTSAAMAAGLAWLPKLLLIAEKTFQELENEEEEEEDEEEEVCNQSAMLPTY